MSDSINHFTHLGHPLTLDHPLSQSSYSCNACNTPGGGRRFRCAACNFNLHEYCAACPFAISSFMHRSHDLMLVVSPAAAADHGEFRQRSCAVCSDPLIGMFYRCGGCDFNLHPLCSQFAETMHHPMHVSHPLIFESPPAAGVCGVCRSSCDGWRYRCSVCHFDIHLACMIPVRKETVAAPEIPSSDPAEKVSYEMPSRRSRLRKKIFVVAGQLTIGVAASAIYESMIG